jgi:hypothetical protein
MEKGTCAECIGGRRVDVRVRVSRCAYPCGGMQTSAAACVCRAGYFSRWNHTDVSTRPSGAGTDDLCTPCDDQFLHCDAATGALFSCRAAARSLAALRFLSMLLARDPPAAPPLTPVGRDRGGVCSVHVRLSCEYEKAHNSVCAFFVARLPSRECGRLRSCMVLLVYALQGRPWTQFL